MLLGADLRHGNGVGEDEDGEDEGVHDVLGRRLQRPHGDLGGRDAVGECAHDVQVELLLKFAEVGRHCGENDDEQLNRDGSEELMLESFVDAILDQLDDHADD